MCSFHESFHGTRACQVDSVTKRSRGAWRPEGLRGRCLRVQSRLSVGRVAQASPGGPWSAAALW
jgi:hypothetical protein